MLNLFQTRREGLEKVAALVCHVQKRYKKRTAPKETNIDRAQKYFDVSYPPIYGKRWPSVRLGLLCKRKYVAIVNNFSDYGSTIEEFVDAGAEDIRLQYTLISDHMKSLQERIPQTEKDQQNSDPQQKEADSHTSKPIRPSLVKVDDDELALRAQQEPISRYPEEYRQRAMAQGHLAGDEETDFTDRVIVPSQASLGGTGALMDYVPATKLKGLEDWIEETDVFNESNYEDDSIGLKIEKQTDLLTLPEALQIYAFEKGNISNFPQPKMDCQLHVLSHYALDGASLLPVLALDLQPGDRLLDLCAAPGGKTLIALQSLVPSLVVSNDVIQSRVTRIRNVLRQYIPSGLKNVEQLVHVTQRNGCRIEEEEAYDKVLVDVPCLTDRHVLSENDNNIFKPSRTKERLTMPNLQVALLVSALHAVRPGGTVVYSTCTLSPLQNDGVVHMAITRIWQETTIECSVVNLNYAVQPFKFLFRFGKKLGLRYGQIVLPWLPNNFGPMYFAKIKRLR